MKRRGRLFLDVSLPVALYSLITIVAEFVVIFAMLIVFYAAHTGGESADVSAKAKDFVISNAILVSLLSHVIIIGVIFLDSKIRKVSILDYTQFSKSIGLGGGVSAVLCGLSFSLWLSVMLSLLPLPESWLGDYAEASSGLDETSFLAVIAVGILGPIVEEMIFRGIIYKHLHICIPEYLVIVLQAVIFAALHGDTVIWVSYAFIGGLLLGYIRMLTGSIRSTVLTHMAFNMTGYIVGILGNEITMLLVALSPVILIFSVRYMYKKSIASE